MKAFVVSRSGRSKTAAGCTRRVTMRTRPGTIRRGIDIHSFGGSRSMVRGTSTWVWFLALGAIALPGTDKALDDLDGDQRCRRATRTESARSPANAADAGAPAAPVSVPPSGQFPQDSPPRLIRGRARELDVADLGRVDHNPSHAGLPGIPTAVAPFACSITAELEELSRVDIPPRSCQHRSGHGGG